MRSYLDDEQESTPAENRKERRWNIPVPVRVRGVGEDGKEFEEETITADASPSGMCLLLTAQVQGGDRVTITAAEEGFEGKATVAHVSALGPGMNRVRVRFGRQTKFGREQAAKKYVYDYSSDNWVGYLLEGTYYNSKHEPFGKIEEHHILSLDTGKPIFTLQAGRVYDPRGNCVGHLI